MKKLILPVVAIAAFSLGSCKKDYTCSCDSGDYTLTDSKKSAAAAVCEGKGIGGIKYGDVTVDNSNSDNCSLK